MRRVVITGIGSLTSAGAGYEALLGKIEALEINPQPLPVKYLARYAYQSRFYLPLQPVSLESHGLPAAYHTAMQEEDRIAAVCAKLALSDAGYDNAVKDKKLVCPGLGRYGIIIGTGLSCLDRAFKSYLAHTVPDTAKLAEDLDIKIHYNRMVIPQTMPNSVAAWVALLVPGCEGHYTLNSACASGTMAIGEAFQKIKDGYQDVMLSGGVEYLGDELGAVMRGFDTLGTLTRSTDGLPRPFSSSRSGFLFAEGGGTLLVLEELGHARNRGARIIAEIENYQTNSDAYSIVQMDPSGANIRKLLQKLRDNQPVDYINAHGTGTGANDAVEAQAIENVFGSPAEQPLINSTKGLLGHTLGAAGAIEAAVTALAISRGIVHGNLTDEPLPGLNLPLAAVHGPVNRALTMSYGFGGHNAGLCLKRYQAHE